MTEQEVLSSVAQQIIIQFLTNEGVKPSEFVTRLKAQFGFSTLSQNHVYTWARDMVNVQRRIQDGLDVLQYFTTREWIFKNDNLIALRESMNRIDRQMFTLDFEKIDPVKYIATCVLGSRHYLLKEDPASLPRSRKIIKVFYVLDLATSALFYIFLAWILVSCSDTARYLLDSATEMLFTIPVLRSLK